MLPVRPLLALLPRDFHGLIEELSGGAFGVLCRGGVGVAEGSSKTTFAPGF
jgi:hypothetical protein